MKNGGAVACGPCQRGCADFRWVFNTNHRCLLSVIESEGLFLTVPTVASLSFGSTAEAGMSFPSMLRLSNMDCAVCVINRCVRCPKFRIIFSVEQEFIIDKTLIILTFCNNLKSIGSAPTSMSTGKGVAMCQIGSLAIWRTDIYAGLCGFKNRIPLSPSVSARINTPAAFTFTFFTNVTSTSRV